MLRGVLAGQRDSPTVYKKIHATLIARFTSRLQAHFMAAHTAVANEQQKLAAEIVEVRRKKCAN